MSFEIKRWDGLGKIANFQVNGKKMETPALFPVVHPVLQSISAKRLKDEFGFNQIITSAYLLKKKIDQGIEVKSIHSFLEFDGIIMMDSGAYQLMVYGDVELDQEGSMELQRKVGADIGVILDHPIGYNVSYIEARKRVETTIERVKDAISQMKDEDPIWTFPIQGGRYEELIEEYLEKCGTEDNLTNFGFFALGSVVQVMINQDYETMVKMITTARKMMPVEKPFHLFGAGHPAMFALAVFLGCDTFDSAAYSLMANDDRYMTSQRTYKLGELKTLPCVCPVCNGRTIEDLQKIKKEKRKTLLAEHNLWVSVEEIKRIKLAIERGNLWDLVWLRANSVPNLGRATKLAIQLYMEDPKFREIIIQGTPISKPYALNVFSPHDLMRPEILRVKGWVKEYLGTVDIKNPIIVFFEFGKSSFRKLPDLLLKEVPSEVVQRLFIFSPIFGVFPFGISESYPLSQNTSELTYNEISVADIREQIRKFQGKITIIKPISIKKDVIESLFNGYEFEIIESDKPGTMIVNLQSIDSRYSQN